MKLGILIKFLNQADFLADFNQVDWEGITVSDDNSVMLWQHWQENLLSITDFLNMRL